MTRSGSAHPLDVELADLADGTLDQGRAARIDAHLAVCTVCRIKRVRLTGAPPPAPDTDAGPLASPSFEVPAVDESGEAAVGEIRLAGDDARMLVLVLGAEQGTVLVAPVTFDVEAADHETVVIGAGYSPLPAEIGRAHV